MAASPRSPTSQPSRRSAVLASLIALAFAAAPLAGCVRDVTASGTQHLEVAVAGDAPSVSVRVEMFNGPIEVRAGADGLVSAIVTTTGTGRSKEEAEADRAKVQVTLDANPDGSVLLRATYQPIPARPTIGPRALSWRSPRARPSTCGPRTATSRPPASAGRSRSPRATAPSAWRRLPRG